MAQIPGVPAKHAIITDTCRTGRGEDGAIDEALKRLRDEYLNCARGWPVGKGVKFHIALIVERPTAELRGFLKPE